MEELQLINNKKTDRIMNRKDILRNPNGYTLEQLVEAIRIELVSYDELLEYGLLFAKRGELLKLIIEPFWQECLDKNTVEGYQELLNRYPNSEYAETARQKISSLQESLIEEERYWENTCRENTMLAYQMYLDKYSKGKYRSDAEYKIELLVNESKQKKEELFEEMRYSPQKFDSSRVKDIFEGRDTKYYDVQITPEELVNQGLITSNALSSILRGYRFELNQKSIAELPPLPIGFSDVYLFGVPSSGKSCVLSGLLYTADKLGETEYIPQEYNGIDPCRDYYDNITNCLEYCMVPEATGSETCNFMSLKLRHDKDNVRTSYNKLSMIEMGGEFFVATTESFTNANIDISEHGIVKYLSNNNRKIIFFVIDYSKVLASAYNDFRTSETKQKISLQRALDVFSTDGKGKDRSENCTFSKTDSVIVIITKSDLMGVESREERLEIGKEYLRDVYESFMVNLREKCRHFGINKVVDYRPLVTTFSLGDFMIGNTVNYNSRDAQEILKLLKYNTRSNTSGSSISVLLKNIFSLS